MLSWSSVLILISIDPTDSGKPAPWWRVWALPTVLRTPLSPNPCCGPYPWVLRKTDGPTLEVRPCTYMLMRMRGQRDTVFAEWELLIDGSQMSDCWINPVGTLAVLLNALFSFSILKYGPISFFSSHFILTLLLYVLYLFQIILLCGFLKLLLFFILSLTVVQYDCLVVTRIVPQLCRQQQYNSFSLNRWGSLRDLPLVPSCSGLQLISLEPSELTAFCLQTDSQLARFLQSSNSILGLWLDV